MVADRGVEEEIRIRMAAIPVTGDVTETIMADQHISVTAGDAETPRVEMEAPALDPADAMKAIPVTGAVTEMVAAKDGISVTAEETETPAKRGRGRPPKADGAMTQAERSRRYREKHRPAWQDRRVDLYASTVERAEKLATEQGASVAGVIDRALSEHSIRVWEDRFERAKAAAEKAGEDVGDMVNFALGRISESEWNEIAEGQIRYKAKEAAKA
ncbi:hypothetical protein RsS62_46190 [Rhizobium dioscoreae]|uniref:hypothetical protein n=1 Tax=Rhizobium dioscoreae TaxID=2653122 RepID=UPI00126091B3|nr:hypothetical protein [Rhizobium dioscoreae]GES45367.1 hypothetical protein RsS62_46190 [Rhizobium dioscoreae]